MDNIHNEAKKINRQIMSAKPYVPFYISDDGNDAIFTGEKNNNQIEVFFATIINGEHTAACVHYIYKDANDTIGIAAIVKHFYENAIDTVKKLNVSLNK